MRHTFRYTLVGEPAPGALLDLEPRDGRHLTRVVRRGVGDPLEVIDGSGRIWPAVIEDGGPPVRVRLASAPRLAPPALALDLYVGLAEWGRIDLAVEKCTELGVRRITLFTSERSRRAGADVMGRRRERMERLIEAAQRQSGISRPPELHGLVPFSDVIGDLAAASGFLLDASGGVGLGDALRASGATQAAIVVGPDAGFTADEVDAARAAGAAVCRLGASMLRTETAAIAASAVAVDHLASRGF